MEKTLIILRHAKAESGAGGQDDHARHINARGLQAAGIIGTYLKQKAIKPDLVVCSGAVRARETWAGVQQAYGAPLSVEYNEKLYLASANETLKQLSSLPETVKQVLVVGHNPGLHQLAVKMARYGKENLLDTLAIKFPTCALATITFDETWHDAVQARGTLVDFVTPKMLGGDDD